MSRYINIIVFCLLVIQTNGQYEGDICDRSGVEGVCRNIRKCPSAVDDIRNKRKPLLCSFSNTDPIVCCADVSPQTQTTSRMPVLTTNRISTTSENMWYVFTSHGRGLRPKDAPNQDQCEPIAVNLTAPKTGQKAWDKCVEYQHSLIFPCEKGITPSGSFGRVNKCHHAFSDLLLGRQDATESEFPHMVLLGYGKNTNSLQWLCGGSLISERFILTAGHCTSSRDAGLVSHVHVGALRADPLTPAQLYVVSDIIKHPQYNVPQQYNDIALLRLDRDVFLDEFTVPACLDVGADGDYSQVLATGWGAAQDKGRSAHHLQKVTLYKLSSHECSALFPPTHLLKQGFDVNTQICYGDKNKSRDTCQDIIQRKSPLLYCMYTVVGFSSFGSACGYFAEPGLYTGVAAFVPWIESIVWR